MENRSAIAAAGKRQRTRNISAKVQEIVISPIKEMAIIADKLKERGGESIISFGQGIPYYDTPAHVKEAMRKSLDETDTAVYSLEPGMPRLKELVARKLEKRKGIAHIDGESEVFITVGCQEAVACAIMSVAGEGDEVLLPDPSFASHIEQIRLAGARPVFVPLIEKDGWKLDVEGFRKKAGRKAKAILLCTPSNPTGAVPSEKEIRELVSIAQEKDLIIITDETYDFLIYDGVKHFSPASMPEARDRVIMCGSFSKEYAMTGYRVGFAYAEEGLIDQMLKVHDAIAICSPVIAQKGAIAALEGPQACVDSFRKMLSDNRESMCRELDRLSDILEYHRPKGAYYILAKVRRPDIDSIKLSLKILAEAKVVTIPGVAFGPSGEGHLRFSFAGSPDKIKAGFERLTAWSKKWKREGYSLDYGKIY